MTFLANLARRGREHPALVRPRVLALFEPTSDAPYEALDEREERVTARPAAPAIERRGASAQPPAHVARQAARPRQADDADSDSSRSRPAREPAASRAVVAPRAARPRPPARPSVAAPSTSGGEALSLRSAPPVAGQAAPARALPSPANSPATADAPARTPADVHLDAEEVRVPAAEHAPAVAAPSPPATVDNLGPAHTQASPRSPASLLAQTPPSPARGSRAAPDDSAQLVAGQPLVVRALPAPATPPRRLAAAPPGLPRAASAAPPPQLAPPPDVAEPPAVHVTIGRIEVRATTSAAPPRMTREQAPPQMSLQEHLRERAGGGR
jgi:hypothetical protein